MPDPVIISSYNEGRHNADLDKAVSRIDRDAMWKDLSTIQITPTKTPVDLSGLNRDERRMLEQLLKKGDLRLSGGINPKIVASWENVILPPNNRFIRLTTLDMEVGEAYSRCIESILAHPDLSNWKFILTREHDNAPPPDGFTRLAQLMEEHPEFAAIGGLYWTKGPGGAPQIWGDPKDPHLNYRPQKPDPNGGLVECCGLGMGWTLFRLSVFKDKRLQRPWFKTVANTADGVGTQDLRWATDARKHGYRFAVACDVRVGHWDDSTATMW